ncbi:LolA family protein [Phenylobacterium sp.]|jgi:outer membrane lipoprotein-sorting protein|uniref:LolA family protein n=1 Tax=Phenylobacterium sp. TaxID=1871053 RepID=UPI002F95C1DC
MSLTRRSLSIALAASAFAPSALAQNAALSADDKALVDRAVAYLQGMTEAKGRFVQTDARGRNSQGSIYLKRPGKARFAYDPPSGLTVVSDGAAVLVKDDRLKTFDRYPLASTPLSLFLAKQIRLDRGVSVTRLARHADGFTITARDGTKKTAGQISLTFTNAPMQLTGWAVVDAQGRQTRVKLVGLERASGLDAGLFTMKNPFRQTQKGPGRV